MVAGPGPCRRGSLGCEALENGAEDGDDAAEADEKSADEAEDGSEETADDTHGQVLSCGVRGTAVGRGEPDVLQFVTATVFTINTTGLRFHFVRQGKWKPRPVYGRGLCSATGGRRGRGLRDR